MTGIDIEILCMVEKCIINLMKEKKYLKQISKNDMRFLEDSIGRALQEYKNINSLDYCTKNDIQNRIRLKEKEVEINMSVRHPDAYYIGNWLECWEKQKYLRDKEWLNKMESVDDVLE